MSSSTRHSGTTPRVWILFGTTRGDNAQLLILAQALGWPLEVRGDIDGVACTIGDRLMDSAGLRLPRKKRLLNSLIWPDLILITGGRRVVDARRIQAASAGRSRIVCVGRPWAPLGWFDLVITTPQYGLPTRPNVLHNTMPLNQPTQGVLDEAAAEWRGDVIHLPRPWTGVLVGGDSGSCRFDVESARRLTEDVNALAEKTGGSLLVSTSARTSKQAADVLMAGLEAPHVFHRWQAGGSRNPYLGFLALADRFVVTSDSASMIAEACSTGRPVSLFDIPLRARSRFLAKPGAKRTAGRWQAWRDRLVAAGLWIPARDMAEYHRRLRERGAVMDSVRDDRTFVQVIPIDLERAVEAVRKLFPRMRNSVAIEPISMERDERKVHGFAPAD